MGNELLIFAGAFGGTALFIGGFMFGKNMAEKISDDRLRMERELSDQGRKADTEQAKAMIEQVKMQFEMQVREMERRHEEELKAQI